MGTTEMASIIRNAAALHLRRSGTRAMSTAMSAEENLAMQRLYPHMRTSWFGDGTGGGSWDEARKRWLIMEVYPLFAAIGGGCLICTVHCLRHLFKSPDVMVNKGKRQDAMIQNHKEGEHWKGNPF